MGNFIDLLMEFLGLKQTAGQKLPKLKAAVKPAVKELPAIPSITPKHARLVFKKKEFVQPLALRKKKFSWKPRQGRFAAKTSRSALQFEVEKVLKEAIALKKKLERIQGRRKIPKSKQLKKQKPRQLKKQKREKKQKAEVRKKFKRLTRPEVEEFRNRLQNKKQLSEGEIERMKAHLKSDGIERQVSEFDLGRMKEHLNKASEIPEGKIPVLVSEGMIVQQQAIPTNAEVAETIDDQIKGTEELLKRLETDFLKRRISEQEYRQRAMDLKQKLNELRVKKKLNAEKQGTALQNPLAKTTAGTRVFSGQASGKRSEGKIEELHGMVQELVKRAKIPESAVQAEVSKIDKAKLFENTGKVVDLIELEQKTQKLMQENLELEKQKKQSLLEKPEFGSGFESGIPFKKKEEIKEVVAELEKHRIITDFDKILELIQEKGRISSSDALKELKVSKQRLNECLEVLEENKLVRVEFPPMGSAVIYDINYLPAVKAKNSKGRELQ